MIRSWAILAPPIQNAIHQLKYNRDKGLGEAFMGPLSGLLRKNNWKIDLLIPVPLDAKRKAERGYNQSALLAQPVAWQLGIPYTDQALARIRITNQQVGLNVREREENLVGAFLADSNLVRQKSILIIDDVVTTGATINACSRALISGGANQVYGMSLARSLHP
jgi:ComF family protein